MTKRPLASRRHQRRGSALFICLAMITGICLLSTVIIDLGYLYGCRSRMQNAADAAALAAAMRIGNDNTEASRDEAANYAISFANQNLPGRGSVLTGDDVVFGMWDPANKAFTEGGSAPNAVKVVVRRDGNNGQSVGTFFMGMFGTRDVSIATVATATIAPASSVVGIPMALRGPGFGDVDPKVSDANPGKDGPSSPWNDSFFEVGEEVVVATYGQGSQPPVHLTLDLGPTPAEVMKLLKGGSVPIEIQVGDEVKVFNKGVGSNNYCESLDERLSLAADDPGRDIIMAVVEILPDSRDGSGKLTGDVRVSDFVGVHLDGIDTIWVNDPNKPSKQIKIKQLIGTITNKRTITSWGGATPSGAGGGTVTIPELVN